RAFANLLQWHRHHPRLGKKAVTTQFSTFGFCVSFQESFETWCSGGTLVVVPEEKRRNLEALMELLRENQVERLYLPFAALKHLAELGWSGDRLPARLTDVVTAGEQLQVTPTVRAFFKALGDCALHNHYGASETHVVSALTLTGDPDGWPEIPPAGHAIANTRLYVLDRHQQPVPVGVAGELYAGGACIPRGYLGDARLSAAKLVPSPFRADEVLYRTGDLARFDAQGAVQVLGRVDQQVKIRGFRIELGEVESALRHDAAVRDAAVLAAPDARGTKRLVAYVVFEDGAGAEQAAHLRNRLKERLPEYMVPAVFVPMDRLPVNANGKLDQPALPNADAYAADAAAHVAPRTPAEQTLAAIWAEVLGAERVGVTDNFFDLGGHSLLATRLISRIREAFGAELPLRAVFEAPTVAELAAKVAAAPAAPVAAAPSVVAASRQAHRRSLSSLSAANLTGTNR
ncbi:MAG TPA: non-ribosomal peptide synthetase, partial [Longimicrobium sp.]|nr:non-ribosomal peptide synthetase [Longimicrobium sp.]